METPREYGRWMPRNGDTYFVIVAHSAIQRLQWKDTDADYEAWNFGNCFKDRRAAKHARAEMKKMLAVRHVLTHDEAVQPEVEVEK